MAQGSIITAGLIVIGGSSGSLDAIISILDLLHPSFAIPLIIVLHRNSDANESFTALLSAKTTLTVKEADEKDMITPGFVYLAPPDYHLLMEKDGSLSLDGSEKVMYSRPSIDVTFQSAAGVYKEKLVAILLSGANADGSIGIAATKETGGTTIVQDPVEASFDYMPLHAMAQNKVDKVLNSAAIAAYLNELGRQY